MTDLWLLSGLIGFFLLTAALVQVADRLGSTEGQR